jgi:ABC-2 type transport system permease protein
VAVMFLVAKLVFGFHMDGNYLTLAVVVMLGIFTIFGIGLAIGGWAKNENQAAPLANIIVFPMMFLTGVFFPVFLMPSWLQRVSTYLPLTPVINSIRMVITEHANLITIDHQLGLVVLWAVVIYAIAFRVFRWE